MKKWLLSFVWKIQCWLMFRALISRKPTGPVYLLTDWLRRKLAPKIIVIPGIDGGGADDLTAIATLIDETWVVKRKVGK